MQKTFEVTNDLEKYGKAPPVTKSHKAAIKFLRRNKLTIDAVFVDHDYSPFVCQPVFIYELHLKKITGEIIATIPRFYGSYCDATLGLHINAYDALYLFADACGVDDDIDCHYHGLGIDLDFSGMTITAIKEKIEGYEKEHANSVLIRAALEKHLKPSEFSFLQYDFLNQ